MFAYGTFVNICGRISFNDAYSIPTISAKTTETNTSHLNHTSTQHCSA